VVMHAIDRVMATGVIVSIELPNIGMAGMAYSMEPAVLATITPALVRLDLSWPTISATSGCVCLLRPSGDARRWCIWT
jgi:hypothetical protein